MADEFVGGVQGSVGIEDRTPAALAKLKAALDSVEKELLDLGNSFRMASASGQALYHDVDTLTVRKVQLEKQIELVSTSLQRQSRAADLNSKAFRDNALAISRLDTSMSGIQQGATGAGRGILLFSQAVEDAQYGLSAVVNNVPGILMAFGAGAGMAGVVSLAAVGIQQLTKNWGGLTEVLIGAPVQTAVEKMEALGKATKLTADEQARLNQLKRDERVFEGMLANRSPEEKKQEKAGAAAIGGFNGDELARSIRAALEATGAAAKITPQEQKLLSAAPRMDMWARDSSVGGWVKRTVAGWMGFQGTADAERTIEARRGGLDQTQAQRMMVGMGQLGPTGDAAREQLRNLVEKRPDMFPPGFLQSVLDADPAAVKQQAEWEAQGKLNEQKILKRQALMEGWDKQRFGPFAGDDAVDKFKAARDAKLEADLTNEQKLRVGEFDRAKEIKRVLGMEPGGNIEGQIAEESRMETYAQRMQRLGERLKRATQADVRESQVMGSADLNRAIQSSVTNGVSREVRLLEETKRIQEDIRQAVRDFNKPFKVGAR
jgi:hypothetical protein